MRVKAITGFDHDGRTYSAGDEFEVSEPTARELSDKGLVETFGEHGSKSAPTHENKMAGDHADKGITDTAAANGITRSSPQAAPDSPGSIAGDVLAGDQSVNIRPPEHHSAPKTSTKK